MATTAFHTGPTGAFATRAKQFGVSIAVAIGMLFVVARFTSSITFGDLLLIAVGVTILTKIIFSFFNNPSIFLKALWERIVFVVWVPIALSIIVFTFALRLSLILLKISLKLLIAALVAFVYLIFPVDLIPDFLLGLGQIDDVLLIITVAVWGMSHAIKESLLTSIRVARPKTQFP